MRQASAERSGPRQATAGAGRAGCGSHLDLPRCFLSSIRNAWLQHPRPCRPSSALLQSHFGKSAARALSCSTVLVLLLSSIELWATTRGTPQHERSPRCPPCSGRATGRHKATGPFALARRSRLPAPPVCPAFLPPSSRVQCWAAPWSPRWLNARPRPPASSPPEHLSQRRLRAGVP